MNLKIKLTSQKDIEMANWLKGKVPEISDEITSVTLRLIKKIK